MIVAHVRTIPSPELPRFNRQRLEKCSIEKQQLYQPKLVAVEMVDLQKTQDMVISCC